MTFDSLTADLTSLMSKLEDLDNGKTYSCTFKRLSALTKNYKVLLRWKQACLRLLVKSIPTFSI